MTLEPEVIHLPGDPPLAVRWRRSARARRLSLKVSRLDGAVTLTLPARTSRRMAMAFLQDRADWLRRAMDGIDGPEAVGAGSAIPVEGRVLVLTPAAVRTARIEGAQLIVPRSRPETAALAFLKLLARDRLTQRVGVHAQALGRTPGKLTLRDTRSRWGSCTHAGDLMFSWRLILAPPRILDYVAAHEVAHLAQMNHSAAFWAEVARLFPAHAEARRWLKTQGAALHRYRFDIA
ncbi:MAG: M48 family metallopeptidase [Pararhodobacter sp.]|nr:M48 family metallopeptidase [Pararhodobacter sp.]